ncbi:hypothetical protein SRHO_G00131070 [Serrasalmus rhombeus]
MSGVNRVRTPEVIWISCHLPHWKSRTDPSQEQKTMSHRVNLSLINVIYSEPLPVTTGRDWLKPVETG